MKLLCPIFYVMFSLWVLIYGLVMREWLLRMFNNGTRPICWPSIGVKHALRPDVTSDWKNFHPFPLFSYFYKHILHWFWITSHLFCLSNSIPNKFVFNWTCSSHCCHIFDQSAKYNPCQLKILDMTMKQHYSVCSRQFAESHSLNVECRKTLQLVLAI